MTDAIMKRLSKMIQKGTRYAFPRWERVSKGLDDPYEICAFI